MSAKTDHVTAEDIEHLEQCKDLMMLDLRGCFTNGIYPDCQTN